MNIPKFPPISEQKKEPLNHIEELYKFFNYHGFKIMKIGASLFYYIPPYILHKYPILIIEYNNNDTVLVTTKNHKEEIITSQIMTPQETIKFVEENYSNQQK